MKRRTLVILSSVLLAIVVGVVAQRWRLDEPDTLVEQKVAAADRDAAPSSAPNAENAKTEDPKDRESKSREVTDAERLETLARAQVWRRPATPIAKAWLGADPNAPKDLSCRFMLSTLGGTTPKFDCVLESGETIRIKYGNGPEIPAEAAATRLLSALGFGADSMTLIEHLRCYGCPAEPFSTMRAVEVTHAEPIYKHVIDYKDHREFEWVALERKLDAPAIETAAVEGWAFFELDKIDERKGGAPHAHVDSLRLMAALLAHWDNKPENQRMVCLADAWKDGTPCPKPFLMIQDAGATFGPSKVDLADWEPAAIWNDRAQCTVSLKHLPYDGATFSDVRITERGRQHLAGLLTQLSDQQLTDLFAGARFDKKHGLFNGAHPVSEWVRVFKAKVKTISDGPACPQA